MGVAKDWVIRSPWWAPGEVKTRGKARQGQGYHRGGAEGYSLAGSVRGAGLLFWRAADMLSRGNLPDARIAG